MADLSPVDSPRRVLSLSRKRRGSSPFLDVDNKASGIGLSGQCGPKPAEVYGFVGSITTVVATDEQSREPQTLTSSTGADDQPIEPISDIGINQINELMFRDMK